MGEGEGSAGGGGEGEGGARKRVVVEEWQRDGEEKGKGILREGGKVRRGR